MEHPDLDNLRSPEELANYQHGVQTRLQALDMEFMGLPMPPEARDEFAELKGLNDEIAKRARSGLATSARMVERS